MKIQTTHWLQNWIVDGNEDADDTFTPELNSCRKISSNLNLTSSETHNSAIKRRQIKTIKKVENLKSQKNKLNNFVLTALDQQVKSQLPDCN